MRTFKPWSPIRFPRWNIIEERNNNVRRRLSEDESDRLSALPDAILTEILSLLPIESAAATSFLSHRWRNLWTGVTRFNLISSPGVGILHILRKLTSPKLRTFRVSPSLDVVEDWESCLSLVCGRNVEEISVGYHQEDVIPVPACVFWCESLVTLELGWFAIIPSNHANIRLPRLKKLRICVDEDSLKFLLPLFERCPLLEVLTLVITDLISSFTVHIYAPNLKSLTIEMIRTHYRNRFFIDAPNLDDLNISDSSSFYCFVNHPTQLNTAFVDFTYRKCVRDDDAMVAQEYIRHSVEFVRGMSNARELKLENGIRIFPYLNLVNYQAMLIFRNLVRFKTVLPNVSGWKDLLLFLQCAPNLKELRVHMEDPKMGERFNWCEPDFVPDCLVSKLKTIRIRMLQALDDEVKLLAYILKNAVVLEKLRLDVYVWNRSEEAQLGREYKFCEDIFTLPRSSLTSKIMFSGYHIRTSSNAILNGLLTCRIRFPILTL